MNRRAIDVLESNIKVPDVLNLHGVKTRGMRCDCPLCHGHGLSLSFTEEVYHCFACGAAGGIIQLEAALSGTTQDEACYKLAKMYGLNIKYREPTKEEIEAAELNKEIEHDYEKWKDEKATTYKGLSRLYREVWKELQDDPDNGVLLELEESLSEWLDDNLGEVLTPWMYVPSKWTTLLTETSRTS